MNSKHPQSSNLIDSSLTCGTCPEKFTNARSLLEHAQFTHKINIFLSDRNRNNMENNLEGQSANNENEIYIDFVQSSTNNKQQAKMSSANGQSSSSSSYNITVSTQSKNDNNDRLNINSNENNNNYCVAFTNNDNSCSSSSSSSSSTSTSTSIARSFKSSQHSNKIKTFDMFKNIKTEDDRPLTGKRKDVTRQNLTCDQYLTTKTNFWEYSYSWV